MGSGTTWSYGKPSWVPSQTSILPLAAPVAGDQRSCPWTGAFGCRTNAEPPCWERRATAARGKHVWKYWAASCFLHLSPLNPSDLHVVFGSQRGVAHGDLAEPAFAQPLGDCHRRGPIKSLQEVFAPGCHGLESRDLVQRSGLLPGSLAFPVLPGSSRACRKVFLHREEA